MTNKEGHHIIDGGIWERMEALEDLAAAKLPTSIIVKRSSF